MRVVHLLAAGIMLGMAGCSQQDSRLETSKPQRPADRPLSSQMFQELCAACHGARARGGVGPDLTVSRFKYGKDRASLEKSILEGRPGGMPAFSAYIKPEDAAALADYLLSL